MAVVQSLSHVQPSVTPWMAARQASLSFTIYRNLLKLLPVESVMPSNYLILSCLLLLLPSVFPSISIFSNELALGVKWPKYWSFRFSFGFSFIFLPVNIQGWFSLGLIGLISLLSKGFCLLRHYKLKASILWCSAIFMVQLSHLCMITGKEA